MGVDCLDCLAFIVTSDNLGDVAVSQLALLRCAHAAVMENGATVGIKCCNGCKHVDYEDEFHC